MYWGWVCVCVCGQTWVMWHQQVCHGVHLSTCPPVQLSNCPPVCSTWTSAYRFKCSGGVEFLTPDPLPQLDMDTWGLGHALWCHTGWAWLQVHQLCPHLDGKLSEWCWSSHPVTHTELKQRKQCGQASKQHSSSVSVSPSCQTQRHVSVSDDWAIPTSSRLQEGHPAPWPWMNPLLDLA